MGSTPRIGPREREVLRAIIEAYIITGEPIGSRTLSRENSERLSPATIRNVMSDLTDAGFLEQPHTSAGRVPTSSAYEFYVKQIATGARISDTHQGMIENSLGGAREVQHLLERTSHVLSVISQNVGVAIAGGPQEVLDHIHFTRLGDQKVLAVVITKGGVVRDRLLRLQSELPQADLEVAARYINENYRGWSLDTLRGDIERLIEAERSEYDQLMKSIEMLYREGALATDGNMREVYLEGAANLLANETNQEKLRELLRTLEEKQRVAELLNAYLDSPNQEQVRVVFGLQDVEPHLKDFVLIGAPAKVDGQVVGSFAVLGPMRIDYQDAITAVSYISGLFERILKES